MGGIINAINRLIEAVKALTISVGDHQKLLFVAKGSTTSVPASAHTPIVFTTEQLDIEGTWNGTRFTCAESGWYNFFGAATISQLEDTKKIIVSIIKNGDYAFATGNNKLIGRATVGGTDICGIGGGATMYLNAGDYIELCLFHNNAAGATVMNAMADMTHFSGYRMF